MNEATEKLKNDLRILLDLLLAHARTSTTQRNAIPSGHAYAILAGKVNLNTFYTIERALIDAGMFTKTGDLLELTDRGIAEADRVIAETKASL